MLRVLAYPAFANKRLNPYTSLLYGHIQSLHSIEIIEFSNGTLIRLLQDVDIWHVHWPEAEINHPHLARALIGFARIFLVISVCRLRKIPIVWTVHNIRPHESKNSLLKRLVYRAMTRVANAFVFLSRATCEDGIRLMGENVADRSWVIPHGHYLPVLRKSPDPTSARLKLDFPAQAKVLLYFGQIRRYKNIPALLRAFLQMDCKDARLIIAGDAGRDDELRGIIRDYQRSDPRISYRDGFVTDDELAVLMGAADAVILPYRDISNSGSVLLALSYGKRVLTVNRGSMPEIQSSVGNHWMTLYEHDISDEILGKFLHDINSTTIEENPDLSDFAWESLASKTATMYWSLVDGVRLAHKNS
jgi:glycosyltransferase involved in cell wall biosynthesis